MKEELNLSDSEFIVMRVIWTLGQASADQVGGELGSFNWSASTIKTFLARLTKKEMIKPTKAGHKYIYQPLKTEDEAIEQMTQEFLRKVCTKKHTDVILKMIDSSDFTGSDKEEIEERISQKSALAQIACNCVEAMHICACDKLEVQV